MNEIKTISPVTPLYPFEAYAHIVSPIPEEEGGGFLLSIPDLPNCISDGETEAEAIENGRDAFVAVVSTLADMGREIPPPRFRPELAAVPNVSGKFVARMPKSLHAQLSARARAEGVSLNTLVLTFLAAGMGQSTPV
ncbi:MAG: type II toxin-antitoxin system HicB family antitoxin [Azoarcus sp.]|jgi:antitoxin HicB|nr:type II toxin-antitoxin system HicB family antitoxin [Azoarcus sp.]